METLDPPDGPDITMGRVDGEASLLDIAVDAILAFACRVRVVEEYGGVTSGNRTARRETVCVREQHQIIQAARGRGSDVLTTVRRCTIPGDQGR